MSDVREAILVLEDGRTFTGESYGAHGETVGEAVFSTGMTGYQETLTDPSYHRQVVVQTAPHIGNTGVNGDDDESSRIRVAGYVVRGLARHGGGQPLRRGQHAAPVHRGTDGRAPLHGGGARPRHQAQRDPAARRP